MWFIKTIFIQFKLYDMARASCNTESTAIATVYFRYIIHDTILNRLTI